MATWWPKIALAASCCKDDAISLVFYLKIIKCEVINYPTGNYLTHLCMQILGSRPNISNLCKPKVFTFFYSYFRNF